MKIDESYATSPKWKGWKFLPFVIEEQPLRLSKEEVPPIEPNDIFAHFDDEKITFRLSSNKLANIGFSNMLFIGTGIVLVGPHVLGFMRVGAFEVNIFSLIASAFMGLYGLYLRLKSRSFPVHIYLSLYRLQGLIELPRDHEGKESFVIRFSDLKALKKSIVTPNVYMGPKIMFIRDASTRLIPKHSDWIGMSWSNNPMAYWSFYVWYMDKNRPLPPGSAFDPYRHRDFERRKAEGFPAPLYESKIPTPEWVPGGRTTTVENLN